MYFLTYIILRRNSKTTKRTDRVIQTITRHRASTSTYSLTFRVRRYARTNCQYARRFVVTATKPVHRLQICPIVHKYWAPLPLPWVTSGTMQWWACGRGQTHRQTCVTNIGLHFASSTTHAKCKYLTVLDKSKFTEKCASQGWHLLTKPVTVCQNMHELGHWWVTGQRMDVRRSLNVSTYRQSGA